MGKMLVVSSFLSTWAWRICGSPCPGCCTPSSPLKKGSTDNWRAMLPWPRAFETSSQEAASRRQMGRDVLAGNEHPCFMCHPLWSYGRGYSDCFDFIALPSCQKFMMKPCFDLVMSKERSLEVVSGVLKTPKTWKSWDKARLSGPGTQALVWWVATVLRPQLRLEITPISTFQMALQERCRAWSWKHRPMPVRTHISFLAQFIQFQTVSSPWVWNWSSTPSKAPRASYAGESKGRRLPNSGAVSWNVASGRAFGCLGCEWVAACCCDVWIFFFEVKHVKQWSFCICSAFQAA